MEWQKSEKKIGIVGGGHEMLVGPPEGLPTPPPLQMSGCATAYALIDYNRSPTTDYLLVINTSYNII